MEFRSSHGSWPGTGQIRSGIIGTADRLALEFVMGFLGSTSGDSEVVPLGSPSAFSAGLEDGCVGCEWEPWNTNLAF